MKRFFTFLFAAVVAVSCNQAKADVIISEIMYNPASSEALPGFAEWIEIYNNGGSSVDISGWTIQDEDGTSTSVLPAATSIAPGEAVVIFDDDSTLAEFQAAWGAGYQAYALDFNSLFGLSNSPSATSEILELLDNVAASVDIANYDDSAPWPVDNGSSSIYVLGNALTTLGNDNGANWALSTAGLDGAFNATASGNFSGDDVGSPGVVPSASIPEPTSAVFLMTLFGLGLVRRRK